jgi:hypothetical protein
MVALPNPFTDDIFELYEISSCSVSAERRPAAAEFQPQSHAAAGELSSDPDDISHVGEIFAYARMLVSKEQRFILDEHALWDDLEQAQIDVNNAFWDTEPLPLFLQAR